MKAKWFFLSVVFFLLFLIVNCGDSATVPVSCETNDDCPEGQACNEGKCRDENIGETCTKDSDCSGNAVCVNKECVEATDNTFQGSLNSIIVGTCFLFSNLSSSGNGQVTFQDETYKWSNEPAGCTICYSRSELLFAVWPVSKKGVLIAGVDIDTVEEGKSVPIVESIFYKDCTDSLCDDTVEASGSGTSGTATFSKLSLFQSGECAVTFEGALRAN